jgi:hypothetical protein
MTDISKTTVERKPGLLDWHIAGYWQPTLCDAALEALNASFGLQDWRGPLPDVIADDYHREYHRLLDEQARRRAQTAIRRQIRNRSQKKMTADEIIASIDNVLPFERPKIEIKPAGFFIAAEPHAFPDETTLKRYSWLLGRHLLRGEVSATVAMGGSGKSSTSIVEALVMASGKQLTHESEPAKPVRVMLINLEDNRNTMDKRIAAAMRHHKLTKEDIGDRLIVIAKGEISFKIAKPAKGGSHSIEARQAKGGVLRNREVINELIRFAKANHIDVLSIDSLIRTHSVPENDNNMMEQVIECYEEVATAAGCAIHLWHHTRKSKDGDGKTTVESARGAGALVDACRSVRVLETMTAKQAESLKVDEDHRQYFRVFSGKRNFAPPIDNSHWYHIEGVILKNGRNPWGQQENNLMSDGDNIGVVEGWTAPAAEDMSPETVAAIKKAVGAGEWREDSRAAMWVGKAIAPHVGLDPDENKAAIGAVIKRLARDGVLKTVQRKDEKRRPRLFVTCA